MSDHSQPERDTDWRQRSRSTDDGLKATRRITKYMTSTLYDGGVDDKGVGGVAVPQEWREGYSWSIPSAIVCNDLNRRYPDIYDAFSHEFRGEFDDDNIGLSFWLSSAALDQGIDKLMLDAHAMGGEVARKIGVASDALEVRLVVPSAEMAEKLGDRAGVGVCIAAHLGQTETINDACRLIHATWKEKPKSPKFLGGKSFEEYANGKRFDFLRNLLSVRGLTENRSVSEDQNSQLPLLPVQVHDHLFIMYLDEDLARHLDGETTTRRQLCFNADDSWHHHDTPAPVNGKGLAMFLDVPFFSSYCGQELGDVYNEDMQPKLNAFCETLSRLCKAPINAHYINLESTLKHTHEHAPNMVVFTTGAGHPAIMESGGKR